MTTPERFRRRQYIGGVILFALGIYTVASTYHLGQEAKDQRECLISVTSGIVDVQTNGREAYLMTAHAQNRVINVALGGGIRSQEDLARLRAQFQSTQKRAASVRAEAPIPPDPEKVC